MTQDDLAEKYFVTRQTISNWENSKSYPDLETLAKISDDYNISLDSLLKEDDKMVKDISKKQKGYGKIKKYQLLLVFFSIVCLGLILYPLVEYIICKIDKLAFSYDFSYISFSLIWGIIAVIILVLPIKDIIKKIGVICIGVLLCISTYTHHFTLLFTENLSLEEYGINGDVDIINLDTQKENIFTSRKKQTFIFIESEKRYLYISDGRNTKKIIHLVDENGKKYKFTYSIDRRGEYKIECEEERK